MTTEVNTEWKGGTWIETYKGHKLDVFNIEPDLIDIFDIAHGLALCNRFNGHTQRPISVAEHSVFVSHYVSPEHALAGLMHDAAEAYISDVPKPIKQMLPEINIIDERLTAAIFDKYGLEYPFDQEIEDMDKMMCLSEAGASGMDVSSWEDYVMEMDHTPVWWTWVEAERAFLHTFKRLTEIGE